LKSVSTSSSVLVGCVDRTVWVKVEGRGTFQNSAGLKEFVKQMIQRGFRDFVVDLRDCEQMDSTFMGTLAGVALRLREIGQGALRAVNVNDRNTGLLSSLGLDQLFSVETLSASGPEHTPDDSQLHEAVASQAGAEAQKKMVLEAHEALVEAEATNAVKFRDVLEFMRQELNQPGSEKEN
jgi:anti-sigma B factor antagonist